MALRVPTPNVSLVDLVVDVEKAVTVEEVNQAFKNAAENEMKGIIKYSEEPSSFHRLLQRRNIRQLLMDYQPLLWTIIK